MFESAKVFFKDTWKTAGVIALVFAAFWNTWSMFASHVPETCLASGFCMSRSWDMMFAPVAFLLAALWLEVIMLSYTRQKLYTFWVERHLTGVMVSMFVSIILRSIGQAALAGTAAQQALIAPFMAAIIVTVSVVWVWCDARPRNPAECLAIFLGICIGFQAGLSLVRGLFSEGLLFTIAFWAFLLVVDCIILGFYELWMYIQTKSTRQLAAR